MALKPEQQSRVKSTLLEIYGSEPMPPKDGGIVFREMASILNTKEAYVSAYAKSLGYWPYTTFQIEEVYRAKNFPPRTIEDVIKDEVKI